MGQKIHPTGFRLAVTRNWNSRWYAEGDNFGTMLAEDVRVREYLKRKLKAASVGRVLIVVQLRMRVLRFSQLVQA